MEEKVSDQQYFDALERFDALLREPNSKEAHWQKLFTECPYALSESLPLKVLPSRIRPLGRPGRSEADFAIVPAPEDPVSPAALVELKRPDQSIFRAYRDEILNLTAEASGAVRQVQHYARSFVWPDRVVGFGNDRFLFVIIGLMSSEASRVREDLIKAQFRNLLPPGVGLLTFDQMFQAFEASVRRRGPKVITLCGVGALRSGLVEEDGSLDLNEDFTFDRFVVGPSNKLAYAAALKVGQNPGRDYNPLFIHGSVGMGKSHLLQSICHALRKRASGLRVVYRSAEEFINEFIRAIQSRRLEHFRDYHRTADLFVLDDVEFLVGKDKSQEELFHTFNAIHNSRNQMVFSSDRSPAEMSAQDRLVSRLRGGLVAGIQQPGFEERFEIVRRKALMHSFELGDDVASFIARQIPTSVRELEDAVIKVVGIAAKTSRSITLELAEESLQ